MNIPTLYFAAFTALIFFQAFTPTNAYASTNDRIITVESNEFRDNTPLSPVPSSSLTSNSLTQAKQSVIEKGLQSVKLSKQQREEKHIGTVKDVRETTISSMNEFWIYESFVTLDNDIDYDGYHSTFSIEFDADTIFSSARVYAVLYIGRNGLYDAIHVSSEFSIFGEEATDSFTIQSTLVKGFPTNDYDLVLELYDADTESLVALTDGNDDISLTLLPLESKNNEYVVEEPVVVIKEYGGSLSLLSLFFAISMAFYRRVKNR